MKKTFFNLPDERKEEIKKICLEEFIEYGYDNASINRIIKRLNIAKGSFYNYTDSKEGLYLFLLQDIYREAEKFQANLEAYQTDDLFDRIDALLSFSVGILRNNPLQYKFLLQGDLDMTSSLYPKAMAIRKEMFQKTYVALFEGVHWEQYRFPKEDVMAIFFWLSAGVQEDLRTRVNSGVEIDAYVKIAQHRLALYKASLAHGIYTVSSEK